MTAALMVFCVLAAGILAALLCLRARGWEIRIHALVQESSAETSRQIEELN